MGWKKILKESKQRTLDLTFEEREKPTLPISDVEQSSITSTRWQKPTSSKRKITRKKPIEVIDEDSTGDDVKENLAEIRAKFLRKPRGLYPELSDKISKLGAKSREEAKDQKKILGYIRKLIRQANIPEADYK